MTNNATSTIPEIGDFIMRMSAHTLWDYGTDPAPVDQTEVPWRIHAATPEWLTNALCGQAISAKVVSAEFDGESTGSTSRARIRLTYAGDPGNADLPASVFGKSSPTLFNRIALTMAGTIENEAKFFSHIRPLLGIEAPKGYFFSYDMNSGRSIQLMEDLVANKGATFCNPRTYLDHDKAMDLVGILAELHGRFYGDENLQDRFGWMRTFPKFFDDSYVPFRLDAFHELAMIEAKDVIPDDIQKRSAEIWPKQLLAVASHASEPMTIIHNDVHLGNWYYTDTGKMGLCDWGGVVIGLWARDFAYAIAATLTVEDRRAWEKDLLALYLAALERHCGARIDFSKAWTLYRQQLIPALLFWTPTLVHNPLMPDMQPRDVSFEMIRRITTAMSDVGTLDAF